MITIITATTKIIASSGTQAQTVQLQSASPSATTKSLASSPVFSSERIGASSGISISTKIGASTGPAAEQSIIASNPVASTATTQILVFEPDFSRSLNLYGIVGTSGSVQKFFDHSPFFSTPSEIDPNTLRDISEAQKFLVYTQATIEATQYFGKTKSSASIITVKGDLPVDTPNTQLLRTSTFAHILTTHPTASGNLPFTISGSTNITQDDIFGPFFDEEDPQRNSTFNDPTDHSLSFHVKDAGLAVDQSTIQVFVDGVKVVNNGAPFISATWPTVTKLVVNNDDILYSLTRSTDFNQQAVVLVSGTFADSDTPANQATQLYTFKMLGSGTLGASITGLADATPPVIIPTEPVNLDTQISPNSSISWRVTDNSAGVNPATVKLILNGELVLANDTALRGSFSRAANSERGFDYEYFPEVPFEFGQTISGTILAVDFAPLLNSGSLSYFFNITPDDSLEIRNFFLDEHESTLLTSGTLGSVEVVDDLYGINLTNTSLTVNGNTPTGLMTTLSGVGPNRIIYSWPVQSGVSFREDLEVLVHAENLFPGAFPVIKEAVYLLRPGYDVDWPNRIIDGPEETFPYLKNVLVNIQAKNFAQNYNTGVDFHRFLIEEQAKSDLGAYLESNIKVSDVSAFINVLNPYFEYGKTMTLELEVADLEGNQLSFAHVFTIEDRPS